MSLVGPRPGLAEELSRHGPHHSTHCSLRQGITGLWQVRGPNDVSYAARVVMDADYARRASLALDSQADTGDGAGIAAVNRSVKVHLRAASERARGKHAPPTCWRPFDGWKLGNVI